MKWRNNPPVPLPAVSRHQRLTFLPPTSSSSCRSWWASPDTFRSVHWRPARETQPRLSIRTDKRNVYFKKLFACLKPQWHDGRLLWLLKANVGLWVKNKRFSNIPRLQTFVATDQEETSQIPRPQTRLYWTVRPLQRSLCVCSAGKEK